jgi:hypothetical protein
MDTNEQLPFELDIRDFVSTLTKIKVSRLTFGHSTKVPKVTFDLGADIKEVETAKGHLRLKYTLYIDANPVVERAELEGEVVISSPAITASTDLQMLGEDKISEIAMQIYAKNYETIYLTFSSVGLTAPPPLLIQDVHMVPGVLDLTTEPVERRSPQIASIAPSQQRAN